MDEQNILVDILYGASLSDIMAIITGLGGLLMGFIALQKYIKSVKEKDLESLSNTLTSVARLEIQLKDIPGAFKFHGIDLENLESLGVTPEELAYLSSSFSIGGIYHRKTSPDQKVSNNMAPFAKDSYRYNLCVSRHMSKAWPEYRKMLDPTDYKKKIEKTMQLANKYLFVYGSLLVVDNINQTLTRKENKLIPAKLNGYIKKMSSVLPNYKLSKTDSGEIVNKVLYMNLEQETNATSLGGLIKVSEDELIQLDMREKNYRRIDITDEIQVLDPSQSNMQITVIYIPLYTTSSNERKV